MLKRCGGRKASGLFKLFDQLPGVQRVHKIDITGFAVEDFERQFAGLHENPGRSLIGIASIFQFKLFRCV